MLSNGERDDRLRSNAPASPFGRPADLPGWWHRSAGRLGGWVVVGLRRGGIYGGLGGPPVCSTGGPGQCSGLCPAQRVAAAAAAAAADTAVEDRTVCEV